MPARRHSRRSRNAFRKSEQVSPAEQYRKQREAFQHKYERAVAEAAYGQPLTVNLPVVLGVLSRTAEQFEADVNAAKARIALNRWVVL